MSRAVLVTVVVGVGLTVAPSAQDPGPAFMPIVMMVGCVEEDGRGGFLLTKATDPLALDDRLPEEPVATTSLGDTEVRLIGTLEEFGVPGHDGHKVRARGLYVEGEDENRLNLTSILMLSPACQ